METTVTTRSSKIRSLWLRSAQLTLALLVVAGLAAPAAAVDEVLLRAASVAPGDVDTPITVAFSNDAVMQGYSVALAYDPFVFSCTNVTEIGGIAPEYFQFTIDDVAGTVVVGAITSLSPLSQDDIAASPDTPVDMLEFAFTVADNALPNPTAFLELTNGVGDPPVNNVYSNVGSDISPTLVNETIEVINPNRYFFSSSAEPSAGFAFTAVLAVEHPFALNAVQIELDWDETVLDLDQLSIAPTEDILLANSGESNIEFEDIVISPVTGSAEIALLFDFNAPFLDTKVIPPGTQDIVELDFTPDGGVLEDDTTTITFTNDGLINSVTYLAGEVAVTPILDDFTITFGPPPTGNLFIRGAVNSDGFVDLSDAIFLVQFQFLDGPTPECMKAADFTDNGTVDIADAISILQWLFNGAPGPDAPYPGCGLDPTGDTLTCDTPTSGCI